MSILYYSYKGTFTERWLGTVLVCILHNNGIMSLVHRTFVCVQIMYTYTKLNENRLDLAFLYYRKYVYEYIIKIKRASTVRYIIEPNHFYGDVVCCTLPNHIIYEHHATVHL